MIDNPLLFFGIFLTIVGSIGLVTDVFSETPILGFFFSNALTIFIVGLVIIGVTLVMSFGPMILQFYIFGAVALVALLILLNLFF